MNETELLAKCKALTDSLLDTYPLWYLLKWQGSKIPRGATIGGVEIGWTQHGMITGSNGMGLGYYSRLLEWGGENGDSHAMVVGCSVTLEPPLGGTATLFKSELHTPSPLT